MTTSGTLEDPVEVLRDLVQVWPDDRPRLRTSDLLLRLTRLRPATYAPWAIEGLERRLRALGVPPVMIQVLDGPDGPRVCRGVTYRDLWARYLVLWEARHPAPRQGPLGAAVWRVIQVASEAARRARRGRGRARR